VPEQVWDSTIFVNEGQGQHVPVVESWNSRKNWQPWYHNTNSDRLLRVMEQQQQQQQVGNHKVFPTAVPKKIQGNRNKQLSRHHKNVLLVLVATRKVDKLLLLLVGRDKWLRWCHSGSFENLLVLAIEFTKLLVVVIEGGQNIGQLRCHHNESFDNLLQVVAIKVDQNLEVTHVVGRNNWPPLRHSGGRLLVAHEIGNPLLALEIGSLQRAMEVGEFLLASLKVGEFPIALHVGKLLVAIVQVREGAGKLCT
jgi:hypothetical protein